MGFTINKLLCCIGWSVGLNFLKMWKFSPRNFGVYQLFFVHMETIPLPFTCLEKTSHNVAQNFKWPSGMLYYYHLRKFWVYVHHHFLVNSHIRKSAVLHIISNGMSSLHSLNGPWLGWGMSYPMPSKFYWRPLGDSKLPSFASPTQHRSHV